MPEKNNNNNQQKHQINDSIKHSDLNESYDKRINEYNNWDNDPLFSGKSRESNSNGSNSDTK